MYCALVFIALRAYCVILSRPGSHLMASSDLHSAPSDLDEENPVGNGLPFREHHWMSAELLSFSVNFIDTLLEDWYPGLGSREGGRTMDSIPYVNRVIPCPFCINKAVPLEEYLADKVRCGQVYRPCFYLKDLCGCVLLLLFLLIVL